MYVLTSEKDSIEDIIQGKFEAFAYTNSCGVEEVALFKLLNG